MKECSCKWYTDAVRTQYGCTFVHNSFAQKLTLSFAARWGFQNTETFREAFIITNPALGEGMSEHSFIKYGSMLVEVVC